MTTEQTGDSGAEIVSCPVACCHSKYCECGDCDTCVSGFNTPLPQPGNMSDKQYLHWSQAGGPNECEHGYAEGIPCPNCDVNPRIVELRTKNELLRAEVADLLPAMDADGMRISDMDREIRRLRAREQEWDGYEQLHDRLMAQMTVIRETAAAAIAGSEKEIERLRAAEEPS